MSFPSAFLNALQSDAYTSRPQFVIEWSNNSPWTCSCFLVVFEMLIFLPLRSWHAEWYYHVEMLICLPSIIRCSAWLHAICHKVQILPLKTEVRTHSVLTCPETKLLPLFDIKIIHYSILTLLDIKGKNMYY